VNDELFTGDLDISSAHTRIQLAALLRTIHLRADKPSLRTLEAITRHDKTPLTKTVVSEMLKGTRRVIRNSLAQAFADLHPIVSKVLISARRA
jgi:hypothetical protein